VKSRKRIICLKLNREEADALMDAGNAGIADLIDAQTDEADATAQITERVLGRLGQLMNAAWPEEETPGDG
jgi:hypothetical protein